MIRFLETVTNCYLKLAQVSFQNPFELVKQNNRQKTQKIPPKVSKINEKPPN